jgi:hypothetical protein
MHSASARFFMHRTLSATKSELECQMGLRLLQEEKVRLGATC